ncbi:MULTISPECIES: AsnC family protein [Rhodococcus erythropolis group]|uniref:AsnC family protein n=1 Tax=Rhodococcus erythropolis TaxID=1833 RepID=A0A8I0ZRH2_RHOER|nr:MULTISPECIES: AsnC family protein [Rhodococcus erythropolis group]MBH5144291.1 AsnC family protein [Rhodococcus erythropolis]MDJ0434747.1 AsnC family protein [Rhodococcus qingshengii]QEM25687.1 AsnC family protein [Rhodococcus qingshengii]
MSWDYDGHEGYAATIVVGGRKVISYGELMELEDGTHVADSDTIGWRTQCTCGWKAPLMFERVTDPAASLERWQVFDTEGGWPPQEVSEVCRAEWLEHIRPEINLAAVRQAAEDHRLSGERLDHAVAGARAGGASWTDIGRAAGVARQTAHERWKALSHSVD